MTTQDNKHGNGGFFSTGDFSGVMAACQQASRAVRT